MNHYINWIKVILITTLQCKHTRNYTNHYVLCVQVLFCKDKCSYRTWYKDKAQQSGVIASSLVLSRSLSTVVRVFLDILAIFHGISIVLLVKFIKLCTWSSSRCRACTVPWRKCASSAQKISILNIINANMSKRTGIMLTIIQCTLVWITKHFISDRQLGKVLLGIRNIFSSVWMVQFWQLVISRLYLWLWSTGLHSENIIIVYCRLCQPSLHTFIICAAWLTYSKWQRYDAGMAQF